MNVSRLNAPRGTRWNVLFVLTALGGSALLAGCGDSTPTNTTTDAATDTPATDTPATDVPATDTPATDVPATDVPTTDAATDAPATDAPATPTCMAYCAAIQGACTGDNQQYGSMEACLGACSSFAVGTAGATSGNTLACRTYHAGAAATGPATHCTHAGPGGDGPCGTNCEGFCTIAQGVCTGANQQFASMAVCMTACAGFATGTRYNTAQTSGNTFACRLYHLSVAASSAASATTHCPHIVAASPVCR